MFDLDKDIYVYVEHRNTSRGSVLMLKICWLARIHMYLLLYVCTIQYNTIQYKNNACFCLKLLLSTAARAFRLIFLL